MALLTKSKFYYGHIVDETNKNLDFNEGGDNLLAELRPGDYTLEEFCIEVARALTEASEIGDYSLAVDRVTRIITVNGPSPFSLLVASGDGRGASPWSLMGFVVQTDRTGASSYVGDQASGQEFNPQFLLQGYTPFDDFEEAAGAVTNTSDYGTVEVVSFGKVRFMECEITYQTNKDIGNDGTWESDPQGETNLRNFMKAIIKKSRIEFMPDRDNPGTYNKCILEKTRSSSSGTGFKLKELRPQMPEFYSSDLLTFREVQ